MPRRRNQRSIWPIMLLIAVVCLAAGAGAAWLTGEHLERSGKTGEQALADLKMPRMEMPRMPDVSLPDLGLRKSESVAPTSEQLAAMSREQLESELRKLSDLVYVKDQQIADLTIQLKLLTEGSRTGE